MNFFFIFWALCETNFVKILFVRLEVGTNKVQNSSSWEDFFLPLFNCSKMLTRHRNCISMLCKLVLLLIQKNFKIVLHKWKKFSCKLNKDQMREKFWWNNIWNSLLQKSVENGLILSNCVITYKTQSIWTPYYIIR